MNARRYRVSLNPVASGGWGDPVVITVRSRLRAVAVAHAWLADRPQRVTRQGGGDRRGAFASVGGRGRAFTIDAPVVVVPSVGDLGYW